MALLSILVIRCSRITWEKYNTHKTICIIVYNFYDSNGVVCVIFLWYQERIVQCSLCVLLWMDIGICAASHTIQSSNVVLEHLHQAVCNHGYHHPYTSTLFNTLKKYMYVKLLSFTNHLIYIDNCISFQIPIFLFTFDVLISFLKVLCIQRFVQLKLPWKLNNQINFSLSDFCYLDACVSVFYMMMIYLSSNQ